MKIAHLRSFKYALYATMGAIAASALELMMLASDVDSALSRPFALLMLASFLLPTSALLALIKAYALSEGEDRKKAWLVAALILFALLLAMFSSLKQYHAVTRGFAL